MRTARFARNDKGFTLVEMMIVVLIIGIIIAVAIPNFIKARENSRTKTCVSNLKQINTAKEQWAMDFKKAEGSTPTQDNLSTEGAESGIYVKEWPQCPAGGRYDIQPLGTTPTCTEAGHVLN